MFFRDNVLFRVGTALEQWWRRFFIGIPFRTSCSEMHLDGKFVSDVSREWGIKNAERLLSSRRSFDLVLRLADDSVTSMYRQSGNVSWVLLVAKRLTLDYTPNTALECVVRDLQDIAKFGGDLSHDGDILPGGLVVNVGRIVDVEPERRLRCLQNIPKVFPFIELMQFGQRVV
jgi:hypothetical protein